MEEMAGEPTRDGVPERVVQATIGLLAEQGPSAIKARTVASASGLSTMAVYHHFGGIAELIRAVADRGFTELDRAFSQVPVTEDPIADLFAMALMTRRVARENPHLYDLMVGLSTRRPTYRPPSDWAMTGNVPRPHTRRERASTTRSRGAAKIRPSLSEMLLTARAPHDPSGVRHASERFRMELSATSARPRSRRTRAAPSNESRAVISTSDSLVPRTTPRRDEGRRVVRLSLCPWGNRRSKAVWRTDGSSAALDEA